ncbi:MAG: TVP38/TMEM64 family protein [Puniceicoccaceae bacterium]|nr:MAG: TVP38/TMEM64 family protein [Puniceicoccaceae bacterium]
MASVATTTTDPHTKKSNPRKTTSPLLKIAGGAAILFGLFVLSRILPVGEWLQDFNAWVGQAGPLGLVVFIGVYIAATVLLLPGAILTVGAGFIFGLGWGFLAVSAGSTIGAALAFLIGRYFARDKIEAATRDNPKFRSVDRAIGQRGAKLIFLLRLSPLIPFNLSNYFYGLTAVRFSSYVLASWLGMMPGTLLYVYFGTLGRVGVEAAAGAETGRTALEWTLLAVGLLIVLGVSWWVSQIARKALQETGEVPADD